MLNFIYGSELANFPTLRHSMFKDRATQFGERLRWEVTVDKNGEERDQYDLLNPLYVLVSDENGCHQGSLRFLPTVGRTMVNEHFLHLTDGIEIRSPYIWECTRFCIAPDAPTCTAPLLLAAGGKLMRESSVCRFLGVFDSRMERIYKRIGAPPIVIGRQSGMDETIGVGLWEFDDFTYKRVLRRARISQMEMELLFVNGSNGANHMLRAS